MYLDCLSMVFIDQTIADIKSFVDYNKLQKEMILDIIIKTLQELKTGSHNHG